VTGLSKKWRATLALGGVIAGLCGAWIVQPLKNEPLLALCYGLSALLLALGVGLPAPEPRLPADAAAGQWPRWKWILAMAGLLFAALLLAASLSGFAHTPEPTPGAWLLFLASLGVLTASFFPLGGRSRRERPRRWELAALAVVLALAALLRLHRLDSYPYGVWFDEAQNSLVANQILTNPGYRPVFVSGLSQMPALLFYVYAVALQVIGQNVLAVRAVTTLAGLLSVAAVWGLARHLFGPTAGIAAAGLLAACRWHVNFSRFGIANIFASLFAPLALLLFFRSQNRRSPREAVLAGLAVGLGMQTYYVMLGIALLLAVVFLQRILAGYWRGVGALGLAGVTALSAAFAYAPVFQYSRRNPEQFSERLRTVSIIPANSAGGLVRLLVRPSAERKTFLEKLGSNLAKHLRMFHIAGDRNGRHNLSGAPMLDPILGWLFAVGVLWSIVSITDSRMTLLLLWLAGMLAAGFLSLDFEAPQGARAFGCTAVVALLAALPLQRLTQWTWLAAGAGGRVLAVSALAAAVAASAAHTWYVFFEQQPYDFASWISFSTQETRIAEVVRDEVDRAGEAADVYVPRALRDLPTETFLLGHPFFALPFQAGQTLPLRRTGRKAILFIDSEEARAIPLVQRYYPKARIEAFGPPRPDGTIGEPTVLWIVRVAPSDIEALENQFGSFVSPRTRAR
jgi:hypothetical protein